MLKSTLVSIIIPTYNRSHLIVATLNSIKEQTYTNWECIIVDDGSTDNTDEILAAYCKKDSRFKYHHRPNDRPKGANACRNYGFSLCTGDLINWFDSDDLMLKDKLFVQVKQLQDSTFDFVICQTMVFDVKNNQEKGLRAKSLVSENIFEDYLLFNIFWLTGAPLWKKSFLLKNNFSFDERLQQAQDYDYHLKILEISENYFAFEEPLVLFNSHDDNMSLSINDSSGKIYSNILIRYKILKLYCYKLSKKTILKVFSELLDYYKTLIREGKYRLAYFCYRSVILNLNRLDFSLIKKTRFIFKISLSLITFVLFKKGEKFLKFNI